MDRTKQSTESEFANARDMFALPADDDDDDDDYNDDGGGEDGDDYSFGDDMSGMTGDLTSRGDLRSAANADSDNDDHSSIGPMVGAKPPGNLEWTMRTTGNESRGVDSLVQIGSLPTTEDGSKCHPSPLSFKCSSCEFVRALCSPEYVPFSDQLTLSERCGVQRLSLRCPLAKR